MHYSDPPILHRDIKVENIILSNNDYKLCDFGSATTNILRGDSIPRNVKDIQLLEEEINNHTTLQYRAPEMLDLYMRKGIDEKIGMFETAGTEWGQSENITMLLMAHSLFSMMEHTRHLGIGRAFVQAVLLHHTFRGARTVGYFERALHYP